MQILITSGGTKVPIDPVRNITNMSSGKFGSELATSALQAGLDVIYLVSSEGKTPFSTDIDFCSNPDLKTITKSLSTLHDFYATYHHHYQEHRYHHFDEYAEKLKSLIITQKPDIVILAAAVSDYLVHNYSNNKVRSSESFSIQLVHAPKLIRSIKEWRPDVFLVGFKLLVNANDSELLKAAMQSIEQNKCDLVVANDLSSIRRGAHEVLVVEGNGTYKKYTDNLAGEIIKRALELVNNR